MRKPAGSFSELVTDVFKRYGTVIVAVAIVLVLLSLVALRYPLIAYIISGAMFLYLTIALLVQEYRLRWGIHRLSKSVRRMSKEGFNVLPPQTGVEPLGELQSALSALQTAGQNRVDDSLLLLETSQDVAHTSKLEDGIPLILNNILTASTAEGARAVIVNPYGGRPLQFGAGLLANGMYSFDRDILLEIRNAGSEILLATPSAIRSRFAVPELTALPTNALAAFPLFADGQPMGAIWVGYQEPKEDGLDSAELNRMRSIVSLALGLVANARLFALAEGQSRRLATVLNSASDAICVLDQTNRLTLINPAMLSAFETTSDDVQRDLLWRHVHDVFTDRALVDILTEQVPNAHGREICGTQQKQYFASIADATGADGKPMGRIAVFHDITDLKQLDELKSEVIASVSHDLRNPLTSMRNYLDLVVTSGDLDSEQTNYIDLTLAELERMNRSIGNLIDLYRVESAHDPLNKQAIVVLPFLQTIAADHEARALAQGNSIVVLESAESLKMLVDEWSIKLAVNNLLGNALTYAAGAGTIALSVSANDNEIILHVTDRGPGISAADQAHIFEKFSRGSEPSTLEKPGSGLGLALVRSIAERHDGRLWVSSEQGVGSTFHLSLPRSF